MGSGHTKQDKFWNKSTREKVGVAPFVEKIVESYIGCSAMCGEDP